jgi:hypothetical protein
VNTEFQLGQKIDAPGTLLHGLVVGSPEANRAILHQAWRPALAAICNGVVAEHLLKLRKFAGGTPLMDEARRLRQL